MLRHIVLVSQHVISVLMINQSINQSIIKP